MLIVLHFIFFKLNIFQDFSDGFFGTIVVFPAMHIIRVRAESMQRASEMVPSGMLSVIGGRRAKYKFICREAEMYVKNNHNISDSVCRVANYLFPDARVLAGNREVLTVPCRFALKPLFNDVVA